VLDPATAPVILAPPRRHRPSAAPGRSIALRRRRRWPGGELQSTEQSCAYGELFTDVPTVGFSTYGEEYLGHINQTATMLLLR